MKGTTEIDRFGRIVVPKATRDALGLGAGARLEIRTEGGEIRLSPVRPVPNLIRRGKLLVATGKLVGDVGDPIKADRDARLGAIVESATGKRR